MCGHYVKTDLKGGLRRIRGDTLKRIPITSNHCEFIYEKLRPGSIIAFESMVLNGAIREVGESTWLEIEEVAAFSFGINIEPTWSFGIFR